MVGKDGWKMVPLEQAEPAVIAAGCLGNGRYTYPPTPPSLVKMLSVYKLNCYHYKPGHLTQATPLRLGEITEQQLTLLP